MISLWAVLLNPNVTILDKNIKVTNNNTRCLAVVIVVLKFILQVLYIKIVLVKSLGLIVMFCL